MTKHHMNYAASIVRAILAGEWTGESPTWASIQWGPEFEIDAYELGNLDRDYVRAVQTAEAFILLFSAFNPRFDQQRFLVACGLASTPSIAWVKGHCASCGVAITATQARMSKMRRDDALPACKDCVSAECVPERKRMAKARTK